MSVVGVKLNGIGKVYFFDENDYKTLDGMDVIIETEKGTQFGKVVSHIDDKDINKKIEYKKDLRIATKADVKKHLSMLSDVDKAIVKCNELIKKYNLEMKIIDASYTFDREQLMFRFLADDRVDFRQLAKDLGSTFKTRIELRQVGIRDKAKEIGGFGPCGRKLCCNNFLAEFESVSINMAKNQNLSLNPTKINGVCGRLMCCLTYENDNYMEYKDGLPEVGHRVTVDGESGKVISVDVFKRTYKVLLSDNVVKVVELKDESKK